MTKKQKMVTGILIFNSLFVAFASVMSRYSEQGFWHHLCLVASVTELAATIAYYVTVIRKQKGNPPPRS